jgi:hypothetical protein
MVCFQTKNPNLGKFWRVLQWKMLVYFRTIWSILRPLEIFYGQVVYFVFIWYILVCCTEKNLATLCPNKFCFIRLNFASSGQIFWRPTKLCVIWLNFVSYDQIMCHPIEFCVVRPNYVSSDWILCRTTKLCVIRLNFVSFDQIMCHLIEFCVVRHQIRVSCKQTKLEDWD